MPRGSQAWMFATPEEMLGKRVIREDTAWGNLPASTADTVFSREFTTSVWDFGTTTTSHHDKEPGQENKATAATSSVQVYNKVKAAEKAGLQAENRVTGKTETSTPGHTVHGNDQTKLRVAGRGPFQTQNKRKGRKTPHREIQGSSALTQRDKQSGSDIHIKANESSQHLEANSLKQKTRNKKNKRKAGSKKVAESALGVEVNRELRSKESEAQQIQGLPLCTVAGSQVGSKDIPCSLLMTNTSTAHENKLFGSEVSHRKTPAKANTEPSAQDLA